MTTNGHKTMCFRCGDLLPVGAEVFWHNQDHDDVRSAFVALRIAPLTPKHLAYEYDVGTHRVLEVFLRHGYFVTLNQTVPKEVIDEIRADLMQSDENGSALELTSRLVSLVMEYPKKQSMTYLV